MTNKLLTYGALLMCLAAPISASAQGIIGGAANGAEKGNDAAGPVGAIVGGAVGAVTGGIDGLLGLNQRPRFREYVVTQHRPSYAFQENVGVGIILPPTGVEYYDVPMEYGAQGYQYTIVNGQTVLIERRSRKIVQIID